MIPASSVASKVAWSASESSGILGAFPRCTESVLHASQEQLDHGRADQGFGIAPDRQRLAKRLGQPRWIHEAGPDEVGTRTADQLGQRLRIAQGIALGGRVQPRSPTAAPDEIRQPT